MTFFHWQDWLTHVTRRLDRSKAEVSVASCRWAEINHLLKDPLTDEDRDKAERLRRVWLANHEAGC